MPPQEISNADLQSIRQLVAPKSKTTEDRRREQKKALSDARVQRWPNTLQALRAKKENAYKERAVGLEAKRLENDRQEELSRARDRRKKIELASSLIYRQTDKMKRLDAAELLADCMSDRAQQILLNRKIQEAETGWEVQFREMEREDRAVRKDREDRELNERKAIAKEIAATQKAQLAEVTARYIAQLTEQKEEGLAIAAKAREDVLEDQRKELARLADGRQMRADLVKGNEKLLLIRGEQAKLEAEEDAKIAAFAARKDELKARQLARFAEIEGTKQRQRQAMIEEGTRRLLNAKQDEGARVENQVKEALAAEDARNDRRAKARKDFATSIDESRQRQLSVKKSEAERTLAKERVFAEKWKAYNVQVEMDELEERRYKLSEAKEHQAFLRHQSEEKYAKDLDVRRREIMHAQRLDRLEAKEEEQFRKIAQQRIARVRKAGKDPYPLQKCLLDCESGQGISPAF